MAPLTESAPALVQTDLRSDRGTIDDRWAAISQTEVPGFAGLWYDQGTGAIVVAATEAGSEGAARDWAASTSASDDVRGAPVRFELVSYDFMQLRNWKVAARELLRRPDVVYIDADEVRNRLVLGVTPGAVTSEVRAWTRELDIPDEGLELATSSPLELNRGGTGGGEATAAAGSATLKDEVRPTMAGLEIQAQDVVSACTLGFNATLGGESGVYFGTASHCSTDRWGDPDDGIWWQDNVGPRVGRESHDIEPHTGSSVSFGGQSYDCSGTPCRFSDASLIAYDDSIDAGDVDLGRLAETTGEGSITIDGRRDITKKLYHYTLKTGQTVQMIGKETGQSTGEITHTCLDTDVEGGPILFLCQFGTDTQVQGGDSGGPIYSFRPDGTVALLGTHVGDHGETSVFSSLDGIEADLNVTLDVCIPTGCYALPPVDVEIDGPDEVLEWSECVYAANASDGFPPYRYRWFIEGDSVTVGGADDELEIDDVGEDDFLLEVRVTDDVNDVEWDDLLVDVSPSHDDCGPVQ